MPIANLIAISTTGNPPVQYEALVIGSEQSLDIDIDGVNPICLAVQLPHPENIAFAKPQT